MARRIPLKHRWGSRHWRLRRRKAGWCWWSRGRSSAPGPGCRGTPVSTCTCMRTLWWEHHRWRPALCPVPSTTAATHTKSLRYFPGKPTERSPARSAAYFSYGSHTTQPCNPRGSAALLSRQQTLCQATHGPRLRASTTAMRENRLMCHSTTRLFLRCTNRDGGPAYLREF